MQSTFFFFWYSAFGSVQEMLPDRWLILLGAAPALPGQADRSA
jgi:hypothetical protein